MRQGTAESYEHRIGRARRYLEQRLDEEVTLDSVGAAACFSPFHFHRVFRGMTGESVMAHLRRLRLERAARRLRSGETRILDIALEAGFESHEAFTRAFRGAFGVAPAEYRGERPPEAPALDPPGGAKFVDMGEIRALCLRHTGSYDTVGETWRRFFPLAQTFSAEYFGILHDDPEVTRPENLRYDAAIPTSRESAPAGLSLEIVPPARYASARHSGPYSNLSETYARLCGVWAPAQGCELAARPALEFYRNNPQWSRPEDLITDIFVPVET